MMNNAEIQKIFHNFTGSRGVNRKPGYIIRAGVAEGYNETQSTKR